MMFNNLVFPIFCGRCMIQANTCISHHPRHRRLTHRFGGFLNSNQLLKIDVKSRLAVPAKTIWETWRVTDLPIPKTPLTNKNRNGFAILYFLVGCTCIIIENQQENRMVKYSLSIVQEFIV